MSAAVSRRQATSLASAGIVALGAASGLPEPDGSAEMAATAIDDGSDEFAVEVEQADRTATAASAAARHANLVMHGPCAFALSFTGPPIVVLEV